MRSSVTNSALLIFNAVFSLASSSILVASSLTRCHASLSSAALAGSP